MDIERALAINAMLMTCHLHMNEVIEGEVPCLDMITPAEALEAAQTAAQISTPDSPPMLHLIFDTPGAVIRAYTYAVIQMRRPDRLVTLAPVDSPVRRRRGYKTARVTRAPVPG